MSEKTVLSVLMALLTLGVGCSSSDSATSLYIYDANTSSIKIWDNLSAAYEAGSLPDPTRTITHNYLGDVKDLAWGGMVLDSPNNKLYLVSKAGKVVRIDQAATQNGAITDNSSITEFSMTPQLSSSEYGQIAVDGSGTLYGTESTATDSKIWIISNAGTATSAPSTTVNFQTVDKDKLACGLACTSSSLFAFYGDGDPIQPSDSTTTYSGPRIRMSSSGLFAASANVIVDSAIKYGKYGSLAFDANNNLLYICHRNSDSTTPTLAPVLAFDTGSFTSPGFAAATPTVTLGDFTTYPNLRFIAHAGSQSWLVAGQISGTSGSDTFYVWNDPGNNATPKSLQVSGANILGMALAAVN